MTTEDSIQPGPRGDGACSHKLAPPLRSARPATTSARADLRITWSQQAAASMMRIGG